MLPGNGLNTGIAAQSRGVLPPKSRQKPRKHVVFSFWQRKTRSVFFLTTRRGTKKKGTPKGTLGAAMRGSYATLRGIQPSAETRSAPIMRSSTRTAAFIVASSELRSVTLTLRSVPTALWNTTWVCIGIPSGLWVDRAATLPSCARSGACHRACCRDPCSASQSRAGCSRSAA